MKNNSGWKYYNHAVIPSCEPHMNPDITLLKNGSLWKGVGKKAILARWTTEYDCNRETEWWYVILDKPFDINQLKAKRRYEINKGRKNFTVKLIDPKEYDEQLYKVTVQAYLSWPEKYRPVVNHDDFINKLHQNDNNRIKVFGAFSVETNELSGYANILEGEKEINFSVLRVISEYEKFGINAALVYEIVDFYSNRISEGCYINDGARSVSHETAFQDYLEKYFGFRKAYCVVNLKYRFPFGALIYLLYPFRNHISSNNKFLYKILGVLKMEEIKRKQN